MPIIDYFRTWDGMLWTIACIPVGTALAWLAVLVINKMPASWLCDYGEVPSKELLEEQRVSFPGHGILMSAVLAISLVMCRLQFNRGFDIYFIVFALIIWIAVMTAVCDIKYMIIPDQFTAALGILGVGLSIYDIVRGFKILHSAWWSPLVGIAIGGGAMLLIDLIGMLLYKKNGMGFGDVKLFAVIGALTGFAGTIYTLIISLLTATVCFVVIIAVSRIHGQHRSSSGTDWQNADTDTNMPSDNNEQPSENDDVSVRSYLAFGPYIAAALIGYIVFFDAVNYLANLYLGLF